MAFTRFYAGLSAQQASDFAEIFTRDGATVLTTEDEGTFVLQVTYPDTIVTGNLPGAPTGSAGAGSASPTSAGAAAPPTPDTSWGRLILALRNAPDLRAQQKIACLSQWIVESGRGTSTLGRQYLNFGGIKYRARMEGYATPVDYTASDGEGVYCRFASEEAFIRGYWHFIASGPYEDWEQFRDSAAGYLRHVAPKYAADPQYLEKVLSCFAEAEGLLAGTGAGEAGQVPSRSSFRLAIVVGHNSVGQGANGVAPISRPEFQFNNAVADRMMEEAAHYNVVAKRFNRVHQGSYNEEIRTVYREVDGWGGNCALELHFNALNAESTGTEMLFAVGSTKSRALATRLVSESGWLHLKLRGGDGLKPLQAGDRGYSSVVASRAPTVLTEPFFGSNPRDCLAAASAGEAGLGRAYLRAVRDWATNDMLN
ncbi:glucosaminidase domain-containing protein [Mesorhizobium sp. M1233]|uniref:glucosaminidase domain-containing protein n=1 Tax=Mesorhizobium sp. M1233 TaxID=2957072 RepID=UPI0033369673